MGSLIDRNNVELKGGDIIDLHQTVNGQRLFYIQSVDPLDVRYLYDRGRVYEYDQEELFTPCRYSGEPDFEIITDIYNLIIGTSNINYRQKLLDVENYVKSELSIELNAKLTKRTSADRVYLLTKIKNIISKK
jgi:hypothetical protein